MVYGVLRQLEYLDIIISRFSRHPLRKMKTRTLMALRLGVYQLLFLDRIPESAAVNETVKAFRGKKGQPNWLVGFVNATLRAIGSKRSLLPGPDCGGQRGLPVLNHPQWIVKRWEKNFGRKTSNEICSQNNREPVLCIRTNTRLINRSDLQVILQEKGVLATVGKYSPDALLLESFSGPITTLPGYNEGLFQVQDEAAQLIAFLLGQFGSSKFYLDACAGLGGKTSHLAQLIPGDAQLTAIEPEDKRFALLESNLIRLRLTERVRKFHMTLDQFCDTIKEKFAAILVDAPCSGTGVIRRHPDIRWNRKPADLPEYQKTQKQLLDMAVSLLEPGGVIVYATCSMEPEENQLVIRSFLERHKQFCTIDCRKFLPVSAVRLVNGDGFFSPTPCDGLDGFFAARLQHC